MKIALVDDDKNELQKLNNYLTKELEQAYSIDEFSNGEDFLSKWELGDYDLIILDIFMGELTGIDVARKIRQQDSNVRIAFCTTSNEFACESYEVNANFYLRKPLNQENIKVMLDRINLKQLELTRSITLDDGQNVILRNILFVDYNDHVITIHNKSGINQKSRVQFSKMEELLGHYSFFCSPSKGIAVNLFEVTYDSNNTFVLSNGDRIPISRRKAKEIKDIYASFQFNKLRNGGDH